MDAQQISERLNTFFSTDQVNGVVAVYLFGSHAAGRSHRESDVDVAVLLDWDEYPSRSERFEARVKISSELIAVLHCNEIDVVILNDAPSLLGRRIVLEGCQVFVGAAQKHHDFVRTVQLLAADLEPFLKRNRQIKLQALAR